MAAQEESTKSQGERFQDLLGELDASSEVFRAVVIHLEVATAAMRDFGVPPSHRLLHELGDCSRLFLRLRREVLAAAAAAELTVEDAELQGIGDLTDWVSGHLNGKGRPTRRGPSVAVMAHAFTPSPMLDLPEEPPPSEPRSEPLQEVSLPTYSHVLSETVDIGELHPEIAAPPHALRDLDPATLNAITTARETAWAGSGADDATVPWPSTDLLFGIEGGLLESRGSRQEAAEGELADLRRQVLPTLDKILAIRSRDDATIPELIVARDAARFLKSSLESHPEPRSLGEARRLCQGDHPLSDLLKMIEGDDSMTDEDWSILHESVSEAFGRALAVVAARQRLVLEPLSP